MILALDNVDVVTISVAGLLVALALIAFLRVLLRREPSPPRWLRFRAGVFVERDPRPEEDTQVTPDEAPTRTDWPTQ